MHRRNDANLEELIDFAAVDIPRDRERGVPRYNRFRKLFHTPPARSFEQMTSDPELAKTLGEVYGYISRCGKTVCHFTIGPTAKSVRDLPIGT